MSTLAPSTPDTLSVDPEVADIFGPVVVVKVSPTLIIGTFRIGQKTGGGPLYPKYPVIDTGLMDALTDAVNAFTASGTDVLVGIHAVTPDVLA